MTSADRFELTAEDRQAIADAAKLSPVEYGLAREPVAEEIARRHGRVREDGTVDPIPLVLLDAEVSALRNGSRAGDAMQGTAVVVADPEPWPGPVDGTELLDELAATFRRFLALPPHADTALALWTLHAHAHDAAEVSPVLALTSPVKRCGKTTALELLAATVPRPLPASNISPASLFRTVEAFHPTLLIDEVDRFVHRNEELIGLLNSGHRRGTAYVIRTVGDDFEPRRFRTWAPKAVALIGRLPDTLADRSIEVAMRRRTREERIERLRLDRLGDLEPLRRRAWRWTRDNLDALRAADPEVPEELHDRAADNWRPLIASANAAGGGWPERALRAALGLSGVQSDDNEPAAVLALHDSAALFEDCGVDVLASAAVVDHLVTLDERPWPEWSHGRPLSKRGLARLLAPFGIRPRALWIEGRTVRGYRREDFDDALRRYAPPAQVQGPQGWRNGAENPASEKCKADPCLAYAKTGETSRRDWALADLTDGRGEGEL